MESSAGEEPAKRPRLNRVVYLGAVALVLAFLFQGGSVGRSVAQRRDGSVQERRSSKAEVELPSLVKLLVLCQKAESLDECLASETAQRVIQGQNPDREADQSPGQCHTPQQPGHPWVQRALLWAVIAVLALLGWMAAGGIDHAPRWLVLWIGQAMQTHPAFQASTQVKPSKVLMYRVDQWFNSHPYSKVVVLLGLTASLIILGGIGLYAVSPEHTLYEALWAAVAGAGLNWSFWEEAAQSGQVLLRIVSLLIAVGGMLITALLLGIVSDALSQKVDDLKRGRSEVLECDHTIILGWSTKILVLLDQLCQAHETSGGRPIVVLSDQDKETMDEEIGRQQYNLRGSKIICRNGNIMSATELHKVSVEHASSIILLADQSNPDQSDARILRTMFTIMGINREAADAVASNAKRKARRSQNASAIKAGILAEMCHEDHEELLQTLMGGPRVRTLGSRGMFGRLMVQCARYPELTSVLTELLGFDGMEFYIDPLLRPQLYGRSFYGIQQIYPEAVPFGIRKSCGTILLNPPGDTVVEEGDQMILLAEDDSKLAPDLPLEGTIDANPAPLTLMQRLRHTISEAQVRLTGALPDSPTSSPKVAAAAAVAEAKARLLSRKERAGDGTPSKAALAWDSILENLHTLPQQPESPSTLPQQEAPLGAAGASEAADVQEAADVTAPHGAGTSPVQPPSPAVLKVLSLMAGRGSRSHAAESPRSFATAEDLGSPRIVGADDGPQGSGPSEEQLADFSKRRALRAISAAIARKRLTRGGGSGTNGTTGGAVSLSRDGSSADVSPALDVNGVKHQHHPADSPLSSPGVNVRSNLEQARLQSSSAGVVTGADMQVQHFDSKPALQDVSEPSLTDLTASAFVASRALNPGRHLSDSLRGSNGGVHQEGHVLPAGDASIGSTVAAIRLSSSAGRHADVATATNATGSVRWSEPAVGQGATDVSPVLAADADNLVLPPQPLLPQLRHVSSERSPTSRSPDWGHSSLRRSVGFAPDVVDHTGDSHNGSTSASNNNQQGSPVVGAGIPGQGPQGTKPLPRMHSMLRRNISRRGQKAFSAAQGTGRVNSNDGANAQASATGASTGMAFSGKFLFCGWRKDMVSLIRVLDEFCTAPSELWLYSDCPIEDRRELLQAGGLDVSSSSADGGVPDLQKLQLVWDSPRTYGSLLHKRQLQMLFPLEFTAIIILASEVDADTSSRSVADMDSKSLATLMLLRQIQVEDLRSGRRGPQRSESADLLPASAHPSLQHTMSTRRHIGIRRAASGDGPSHSRTSDSGASLMPGSSGALGFEGIKEEAHEGADSPDGVTHRHSLVLNPSGGTLRTQPSNGSAAPAPVLPTAATLATGALLKALGVAQAASPSDVASPAPGTDNVYFSPVRSQLPPGVVLQEVQAMRQHRASEDSFDLGGSPDRQQYEPYLQSTPEGTEGGAGNTAAGCDGTASPPYSTAVPQQLQESLENTKEAGGLVPSGISGTMTTTGTEGTYSSAEGPPSKKSLLAGIKKLVSRNPSRQTMMAPATKADNVATEVGNARQAEATDNEDGTSRFARAAAAAVAAIDQELQGGQAQAARADSTNPADGGALMEGAGMAEDRGSGGGSADRTSAGGGTGNTGNAGGTNNSSSGSRTLKKGGSKSSRVVGSSSARSRKASLAKRSSDACQESRAARAAEGAMDGGEQGTAGDGQGVPQDNVQGGERSLKALKSEQRSSRKAARQQHRLAAGSGAGSGTEQGGGPDATGEQGSIDMAKALKAAARRGSTLPLAMLASHMPPLPQPPPGFTLSADGSSLVPVDPSATGSLLDRTASQERQGSISAASGLQLSQQELQLQQSGSLQGAQSGIIAQRPGLEGYDEYDEDEDEDDSEDYSSSDDDDEDEEEEEEGGTEGEDHSHSATTAAAAAAGKAPSAGGGSPLLHRSGSRATPTGAESILAPATGGPAGGPAVTSTGADPSLPTGPTSSSGTLPIARAGSGTNTSTWGSSAGPPESRGSLTRLRALLGGLMPGGASSVAGGSAAGSGAASLNRTDSGRDKGSGSSPVALTRGNSGRHGAIPVPTSFAGIFGRAASGRSDAPSASDGEYASLIANLAQPAGAGEAGGTFGTASKGGTAAVPAGQQYMRRGTSGLGAGVPGSSGEGGMLAPGGTSAAPSTLHRRGGSNNGTLAGATPEGDGDGGVAGVGHTDPHKPGHTLRGVATAAVAVTRVAEGPRRRRASAVQDPAMMAEKLGAAGLEPHPHHQHQGSLFSAMTSLVMGGGHGGRRKKAGAKGAQWLTELSEVVTQCTIVCELLDGKAYQMVKDMHIAQYVLSDEMVAQLLALVATCPERADIFKELFEPGGNELYLRPARWLIGKDEVVSFYEVSKRASAMGECLLGYVTKESKTVLNPPDKGDQNLSRHVIRMVITIAWS